MSCCFCCPVRCGFRSDNENTGGDIQICHLLGWRARIGRPATDDAQLIARVPHLLLAVEDVHGVAVSVPHAAPMRTLTLALVCMPVLAFAFLALLLAVGTVGGAAPLSSREGGVAVVHLIGVLRLGRLESHLPPLDFPFAAPLAEPTADAHPRKAHALAFPRLPLLRRHSLAAYHASMWGPIILTCRHEIETTCPSRNKMAMIICWMLLLLLPQARVLILDLLSFLYV